MASPMFNAAYYKYMTHMILHSLQNPFSCERELSLLSFLASAHERPRVNASLEGDDLHIAAEIPGVHPEDLKLSLHRGVLELSGKWPSTPEGTANSAASRERTTGAFARRLKLPFKVDEEKVTAHFDAGILTIVLPKAENAKPRRIPVLAN